MTSSSVDRTAATDRVDLNALRTNQVLIIGFVVVAFVLGTGNGGAWIVAVAAISMAIGSALPGFGPFQLFYKRVLLKFGLIQPKPRADNPSSHRFAQTLGATFLAGSAILLFAGATTVGWILAAIVVTLALVNLLFDFCAGCFIFFQLRKAGSGT